MIVTLKDDKVIIEDTQLLELSDNVLIQYVYEDNTEHLTPQLFIQDYVYIGDMFYADFSKLNTGEYKVIVNLVDNKGITVRHYEATIAHYRYSVFGNKPVRPDVEQYIRHLKEHIATMKQQHQLEVKRLETVIKELEERGEVI